MQTKQGSKPENEVLAGMKTTAEGTTPDKKLTSGPEHKSRDQNVLGGEPEALHRRNEVRTPAVGSKQAQTPNQ
jgi:hypothetical protein